MSETVSCPFTGKAFGTGTTNRHWWPNALPVDLLLAH